MPNENSKAAEKLEMLSKAVAQAFAKRHPATAQQRAAVRKIIQKHWIEEQSQTPQQAAQAAQQRKNLAQAQARTKQQEPSQEQEQSR